MRFVVAFLAVLALATATRQDHFLAHDSTAKRNPEHSVDSPAINFPHGQTADAQPKGSSAIDEILNRFKEGGVPDHPASWTSKPSELHDQPEVHDEQVLELISSDAETDQDEAAMAAVEPETDLHERDHTMPHTKKHGMGKGMGKGKDKHHHEERDEDHKPHDHEGELQDHDHGSKHPKHHVGGLRGRMRRMADRIMAAIGFKHPHPHAGRRMQHRPAGPPTDDHPSISDDDAAPSPPEHHDDREHGRDHSKRDHDDHDDHHWKQDDHEPGRDHDDHGGLRGKPRHHDRHHDDDDDDDDDKWHHRHHHDHDDGIGGLIALILIIAGVVFMVRRIRRRRRQYAELVATVQQLQVEVARLSSGQSGMPQAPVYAAAPQVPPQSQPQPQAQAPARPPMYPHAHTQADYMNNVSGDRDDAPLLQMRGQSTY